MFRHFIIYEDKKASVCEYLFALYRGRPIWVVLTILLMYNFTTSHENSHRFVDFFYAIIKKMDKKYIFRCIKLI